jgi:hypothetical protein
MSGKRGETYRRCNAVNPALLVSSLSLVKTKRRIPAARLFAARKCYSTARQDKPYCHRQSYFVLRWGKCPMLMSRFVDVLGFLLAMPLAALPPAQVESDLSFTLEPSSSVSIGNPIKLCWSSPKDSVVFISYIGSVTTSGCKDLRPVSSTTFTLLLENNRGVFSRSVKVDVLGQKGVDDDFPSAEQAFTYPVDGTRDGLSFLDFVTRLHRVLQDKMKLSVKKEEYDCATSRVRFVTNLHEDRSLIGNAETTIKGRRFSYKIEVFNSPKRVMYSIVTLVQSQRMVEERWQVDSSEALHRQITDKLTRAIAGM